MNKKLLTIIAAALLVISYFLPFFTAGGILNISLFDTFSFGLDLIGILFILTLIIAAVVLVLAAMGKGTKYALIAGIFALVTVVLAVFIGGTASTLGSAGVSIFSILGIGFWLYVVGAIGLIVAGLLKK